MFKGTETAKLSVAENFDYFMPANNKIIDMCKYLPEVLP